MNQVTKKINYLEGVLKSAITYKDYIKLHPKSKKTPNDPMFSEQKTPPVKPQAAAPEPNVAWANGSLLGTHSFDVAITHDGKNLGQARSSSGVNPLKHFSEYTNPRVKEIFQSLNGKSVSYIENLYIRPEFRGKGYARKIMETSIKTLKEKFPDRPVFLTASPDNPDDMATLVNFYKGMGFEELESRDNGEQEEVLMWLSDPTKFKTATILKQIEKLEAALNPFWFTVNHQP